MKREIKVSIVAMSMLMLVIMAIAAVVGLIVGLVTSSSFAGWVTAVVLTVGCPSLLAVAVWWDRTGRYWWATHQQLHRVQLLVALGGFLCLSASLGIWYVLLFMLS